MLCQFVRQFICRCIAEHRRAFLTKSFAILCKKYLGYYENLNYDPYSNGEQFVLRSLSRKDMSCIFDVGACIGDWASMAHKIFPGATIHCFEIIQPTVERLKENVKQIRNVVVNDFGLSDKEGVVKVRYFPSDPTHSTMAKYPHKLEYIVTNGLVMTGDSYIEKHGIDRVNFLKMDVEGAECLVLHGLFKAITDGKIDVIQFEYGKVNILMNFILRDFYEFFQKHGYIIGKIYPNYVDFRDYDFNHEDFYGPNYLAVRRDQHELIKLMS